MAIVDGRTALSGFESGDTPAQPDDLTGAAGGTADTEIFIQGSRSYGYYSGSTRAGLLYDAGSAQDWSDNTFYIWVNCGVAGLLNIKTNGGLAVRFCGATVSDWFEVYVAGSDDYPNAVQGGWVMLVVDIEKAKTASDATNGTPPATSAIRYVGISTQTPSMPRMADNTWLDAMWRLPASTAGIRVEGQNTGSVDWTWADLLSSSDTNAWGTVKTAPGGGIAINTPIQFGANDAVAHGFSDTNQIILWEDWDVDADFYGVTVIGGSSTQSFELGVKTGTGDDATGAQGGIIAASATGERFFFDADDANIDACNVYGVQFIHGADFQLDDANTSVISCAFVDCTSATVTNAGDFLACSVINANTADGAAFVTTDDITDIVRCSFENSMGYAVELTTPRVASQTSKGNLFSGYGPAVETFDTELDVNGTTEVITVTAHPWSTGDPVLYNDEGGTETPGPTDGTVYWVRSLTASTISLHTSEADANSDTARVNLTASGGGSGETHSLYSGEAAVKNDTAGAVTISITDTGDSPTIANGVGASTTVSADTEITLTGLINGTEVRVYADGTTTELAGIEDVVGNQFVFSQPATDVVDIRIFKTDYEPADIMQFTMPASDASIPVQQRLDRNFSNP